MYFVCRINEAREKKEKVIDVDGSYLYKKIERLNEAGVKVDPVGHPPIPISGWETVSADNCSEYSNPPIPISGWETVSADNCSEYSNKIPIVTQGKTMLFQVMNVYMHNPVMLFVGTVYVYMSESAGVSAGQGAFRALSRGFQHWSSGRMESMEVNLRHPRYCHVRSSIKPSMKLGLYHLYILLKRVGDNGEVVQATCECAAGYD